MTYQTKVQDHFLQSDMVSSAQSNRYKTMWGMADKLLASPTGKVGLFDIDMSNENLAFLKTSPVFSFHHGEVGFNTRAHRTTAQSLKMKRINGKKG